MKLQRSFISNSRKKGIIVYYYLYCITKALQKPLKDMIGLENADVRAVQYKELTAIVSEVMMAKIPVSGENVLRHEVVVEAIQKEQAVLPMKYSSVFKDDAGVIEFLKNRYAVFISDLERLHDKLEMGIRVIQKKVTVRPHIPPPPPFSPSARGTASLSPSLRGTGGGIQGTNVNSPPLVGGVRACPIPDTGGGGELLPSSE